MFGIRNKVKMQCINIKDEQCTRSGLTDGWAQGQATPPGKLNVKVGPHLN